MTIRTVEALPQPDGSTAYIVNGIFTAVQGEPTVWADVQAWLSEGNTAQPYVPPAPVPMDPEMQLYAEIMASLVEEAKKKPEWQARLSVLKGKA